MGRKARFNKNDFLDAALGRLENGGPAAVGMKDVAGAAGAPLGSLYHRFESREMLLAELWVREIERFQAGFLEALAAGDGPRAALHPVRYARERPSRARLLLLFRREEFGAGNWPREIECRVAELAGALDEGVRNYADRLWGAAAPENMARLVFALVDVPAAAVRRFLEQGQTPPAQAEALVLRAFQALMEDEA
ncbi:MAG: TetR/AcrR family transcriptional regulator [Pseudomonadota bacterium]